MPHKPLLLATLLFLGTAGVTAHAEDHHHHHHGAAHADEHQAPAASPSELPKVEAEVRRINAQANTLSVRHGEIPNLDMPPMTMTFQVSDPVLLDGLQVGDTIGVTVDQIDGAYTILSIER